jgi:hypothetical protein
MRKLNVLCVLLAAAVLAVGCGKPVTDPDQASGGQQAATAGKPAPAITATEPVTLAKKAESAIDSNAAPMDAFEYTIRDDNTACILRYSGKDTDVVITSQIDGTPVTEIGQYAFEAATTVESITIPDTVTKIGEFAFQDCESLKTVNIPASVTELSRGTFACCTSLEEITIPASVTVADRELFTGCGLVDLHVQNPSLEYASWGLEDMTSKCMIHAPEGAAILTWAQNNGFPTTIE